VRQSTHKEKETVANNDLLDLGDAPELYSNGIAEVHVIGANARLLMFVWRRIDGVFRRVLAYTSIRPASSLLNDTLCINAATTSQVEPEAVLHWHPSAASARGGSAAARSWSAKETHQMLVHKITSRDEFIVAQALSFSIKVLSTLPAAMRPESNISEMKAILATVPLPFEKMGDVEIERWLRHIPAARDRGWVGGR
jgi:hypothetical protein